MFCHISTFRQQGEFICEHNGNRVGSNASEQNVTNSTCKCSPETSKNRETLLKKIIKHPEPKMARVLHFYHRRDQQDNLRWPLPPFFIFIDPGRSSAITDTN